MKKLFIDLAQAVQGRVSGQAEAVTISDLAYRHDQVRPGSLFFCVRGARYDGHDYAEAAAGRGAVALVGERKLALDLPQLLVEDVRQAMPPIAVRFFDDPTAQLVMVGVTGTNGKTTTAALLRAIFQASGRQCGLMGTIEQVVGGVSLAVERTTPEAIDIQRTAHQMLDATDVACAMEVSSHALAQGRSNQIDFDAAIFTNLTQDHLDFHGSMESYFQSKRELFFRERPPALAVVGSDDEYGRRLKAELRAAGRRAVSFALERPAGYRGVELSDCCRRFDVLIGDSRHITLRTKLPGRFNALNVLAAFSTAVEIGVDPGLAAQALADVEPVPGRFEPVDAGQDFTVVVDYAHTPDSLQKALEAAHEVAAGRVAVVFGCGGDRDRGKRPKMGRIAAELADFALVTSDNPRNEKPEAIVAEILSGIDQERIEEERVEIELDRRRAIARALAWASPGDLVLIAGKGHEQGQEFDQGRRQSFDDRLVAKEELAAVLQA